MVVLTCTCVALLCDVCEDGWGEGLDIEPHFPNPASARAFAAGEGWIVTELRAVCPTCVPVEVCALNGHDWKPWRASGPFPMAGGRVWMGRVRYCRSCLGAEWDPPGRPSERRYRLG